jgi:hypothetical protein
MLDSTRQLGGGGPPLQSRMLEVNEMTNAKIAKNARDTAKAATLVARVPKRPGTASKASASHGRAGSTPTPSKARHKLVRDSFTIPKAEYEVLEGLKDRAANLKRPTKKSELLRAGVVALQAMTDKAFLSVLNGVPSLKTGRPKGPGAEKEKTTGTDA